MNVSEKILNRFDGTTCFRFEAGMRSVVDDLAGKVKEYPSLNDLLCLSLRFYLSQKHPNIELPPVLEKWNKQKTKAKKIRVTYAPLFAST